VPEDGNVSLHRPAAVLKATLSSLHSQSKLAKAPSASRRSSVLWPTEAEKREAPDLPAIIRRRHRRWRKAQDLDRNSKDSLSDDAGELNLN